MSTTPTARPCTAVTGRFYWHQCGRPAVLVYGAAGQFAACATHATGWAIVSGQRI